LPPSPWNLRRLLRELEAKALTQNATFAPALRHGPASDGSLFLDLAADDNRAVHITPHGWSTRDAADLFYFRRSPGAQPLPAPDPVDPAPTLDALSTLLRLSPENAARIQSWLLAALRPEGPYPVLILDGPAASGKSTAARIFRSLLDPHAAPFTPHPGSERQVLRQAYGNRVLVYDHVTHLTPRVQDALARVSTAAAYERHERVAEREPLQLTLSNPILLTANQDWEPRADLASRAVTVTLDVIPQSQQRPQQDVLQEFAALQPRLLATLCQQVSQCLQTGNWPFTSRALPKSQIASQALQQLVASQGTWTGTPTELFLTLQTQHRQRDWPLSQRDWPRDPAALSRLLNQETDSLYAAGLAIERQRAAGGKYRALTISRIAPPPPAPSADHLQ
ncbi:MAG: hypothetical protein ACRD9L_21715, partial [Bryobacteraceae bacterium]